MNIIKKCVAKATGYWLHKLDTLPVGVDLFFDISERIRHPYLNVMFDVGANVGQTRNWFRFYNPKAKIYSFEPVSSTYDELVRNSLHDGNCVLEKIAMGESRSKRTIRLFDKQMNVLNSLHGSLMNNSIGAKEETIVIDTIDQYCEGHAISKIDLLKIDTEGYDLNVLRGAEQMLNRGAIGMIFCETGFQPSNKRNTPFADVTRFLDERDYYFFGLYQLDHHDWKSGNGYGNALYVHKRAMQR